jgi:beta-lactamase class A
MKVAVLAALYRAADAGTIDLDAPVPVVNDFASAAAGAPRFAMDPAYDQDDEVWARMGGSAPLRWLGFRMIVMSSNVAANLVLSHVGIAAVADVLRVAGKTHSRVERGISDTAARDAGLDNEVTARDLAMLLGAIAKGAEGRSSAAAGAVPRPLPGPAIAKPSTCAAMLDVLCAQEHLEDLAAGLPAGTRVAHKNGWVSGVRHATGVVFPNDTAPYAIAVCTTSPLTGTDHDAMARELIARIAAASWADRHVIAAG